MNRALNVMKEIVIDLFYIMTNFFVSNMKNFANVLTVSCPYVMYFIGQYIYTDDLKFIYGYELAIPIAIVLITYFLHSAANKTGKGNMCPVPFKRFTKVSEDGEVSIEYGRLQELLLYVADVEYWLERKGIL